jgi:predicted DNA-binding transcriptional regulator YafY
MRADRLVATLLVLQARGRVTARELATELEISVATARRDLEALSTAGIPVYPQIGRGGGWQLLGGARTDLSGLTSDEARALFLLVGPAAAVMPEAKAALRKLVRALPETFRKDAEAAAAAVVIDPARWGHEQREQPAALSILQEAIVRQVRVRLEYTGWNKPMVQRLVDPWGLVEKEQVWYLLGAVNGMERTYRVDRIGDVFTTKESFIRPSEFDLAEAWALVATRVESRSSRAFAVVLVDRQALPFLRESFSNQPLTDSRPESTRARVRVTAPTEQLVVRKLAGWADQLDVVEPGSIRQELARIATLVEQRHR